eukprot:SAG31_NODE_1657_length_7619_cov_10.364362_2_plen_460_part_00
MAEPSQTFPLSRAAEAARSDPLAPLLSNEAATSASVDLALHPQEAVAANADAANTATSYNIQPHIGGPLAADLSSADGGVDASGGAVLSAPPGEFAAPRPSINHDTERRMRPPVQSSRYSCWRCCGCWNNMVGRCRRRKFVLVKAVAALAFHLGIGVVAFAPFAGSWGCAEDDGGSTCTNSPVVDALYFAVVTLTTVGYGDVVPTEPWAKIFVCVYILFGLTGITLLVSNAVEFLLSKQRDQVFNAISTHAWDGHQIDHSPRVHRSGRCNCCGCRSCWAHLHDHYPRLFAALYPITYMCVSLGLGAGLFYWTEVGNPSSTKPTVLDCFYFALVTATTVGYGDFKPNTEHERAMAIVYVLGSVMVTTWSLGRIVELILDVDGKRVEDMTKAMLNKMTADQVANFDLDGDGKVDEAEYVLAKLIETNAVDIAHVELARRSFREHDTDGDRFLRVGHDGTVS